jgi:hypothetical protein
MRTVESYFIRATFAAIAAVGLATKNFAAERIHTITVLTEVAEPDRPSVPTTGENPLYAAFTVATRSSTGSAKKTKATEAELLRATEKAISKNGYALADASHPPDVVLDVRWGEWLAHGLPDRTSGDNGPQTIEKIHVRAVIVGGKVFANELRAALIRSSTEGDINRAAFGPNANPAQRSMAQGSSKNDPVKRFQERSEKTRYLVDQATTDCYFLTISARSKNSPDGSAGDLLWKSSVTMSSRRFSAEEGVALMMEQAAPWFGRQMAEAEILRRKAK